MDINAQWDLWVNILGFGVWLVIQGLMINRVISRGTD